MPNTTYNAYIKLTVNNTRTTNHKEKYKILITGNNEKKQLQGTMQNTNYMEQYKILITREKIQRYNILGTIQSTPDTWNSTTHISKVEPCMERQSTEGIQVHVSRVCINRETKKLIPGGKSRNKDIRK